MQREGETQLEPRVCMQAAVFERNAPLAAPADPGLIPGATLAFDAAAATPQELAHSAREYAELRSEAFRAEAAPEGLDEMLTRLQGVDVGDSDGDAPD